MNLQSDIIVINGIKYKTYPSKILGEGGTSIIYPLYHTGKRDVTQTEHYLLKKLKVDTLKGRPEFLKNVLRREFEIGKRFSRCKNIVTYYDYLPQQNALIMQYVDGNNLASFTNRNPAYFKGNEGWFHLYKFIKGLLCGLKDMHAQRVYHCDLNERNIIVTNDTHEAVIIDLGMAYQDGDLQVIGNTIEVPETKKSFNAYADSRSDIYLLGRILHFLNISDDRQQYTFIDSIAEKCCRQNPEERYQSIEEIEQIIDGENQKLSCARFFSIIQSPSKVDFKISDSSLYYKEDYIIKLKDIPFFRNNASYIEKVQRLSELNEDINDIYDQLHTDADQERKQKIILRLKDKTDSYNKLQSDLYLYENQLLGFAKSLYCTRNSVLNDKRKKVIELFEAGKYAEASAFYKLSDLDREIEEATESLNTSFDVLKDRIEDYIIKAKGELMQNFNEKGVKTFLKIYLKGLSHSSRLPSEDIFEYYNDLCFYLYDFNLYDEEEDIYLNILVPLCKKLDYSDFYLSRIYLQLGKLYDELERVDDAEKSFKKSLLIRNKLKRTDKDFNTRYLSNIYYYFGKFLNDNGYYKKALSYLQKAKVILENRLSIKGDKSDLDYLANTYSSISTLLRNISKPKQSKQFLQKVLEIARAERDYHALAYVYHDIGIVDDDLGLGVETEQMFIKSIKYYKKLYYEDPDNLAATYANAHNSLGCYYQRVGLYKSAFKYYNLSLRIFKRMKFIKKTSNILYQEAMLYNNLSNCYDDLGIYKMAVILYQKSYDIINYLYELNPNNSYTTSLASYSRNRAILLCELGKKDESLKYCNEALSHYQHLENMYPGLYTSQIAECYNSLGGLCDDNDEAISIYQNALDLLKSLPSQLKTVTVLVHIATICANIGDRYSDNENHEKAIKLYLEGINACHSIKEPDMKSIEIIAYNYCLLGCSYKCINKIKEAESCLLKAEQIIAPNYEYDKVYTLIYGRILNNISIFYYEINELDKSERYNLKARTVFDTQPQRNNSVSFSFSVAKSKELYADILRVKGDLKMSEAVYKECLQVKNRFLKKGVEMDRSLILFFKKIENKLKTFSEKSTNL